MNHSVEIAFPEVHVNDDELAGMGSAKPNQSA
jgi:hypothetical protein